MFTGLIEAKGSLRSITNVGKGGRLTIACPFGPLVLGESVAVSGVCLTAAEVLHDGFVAIASEETLARTNLGALRTGAEVNLERALRVNDRLGGHIVSGHVDGAGALLRRTAIGQAHCLTFGFPPALARYFAEKGSVTIDGVSLTLNRVSDSDFDVAVIPHTETVTTLGNLKPGSQVNLEVDLLARYLERLLRFGGSPPAMSASKEEAWHTQDDAIGALLKNKGYL